MRTSYLEYEFTKNRLLNDIPVIFLMCGSVDKCGDDRFYIIYRFYRGIKFNSHLANFVIKKGQTLEIIHAIII